MYRKGGYMENFNFMWYRIYLKRMEKLLPELYACYGSSVLLTYGDIKRTGLYSTGLKTCRA